MPPERIAADFFARDTVTVARDLVGCVLRRGAVSARIVETEAYTDDAASHFVTRPRTAALMGTTHGVVYVYLIYGMHRCLNVTTDANGPGAVLLRAVEPLTGVEEMAARRGVSDPRRLASGPGKLACALGVDESLTGRPFLGEFSLERPSVPPRIARGPRIGIAKARTLPWRFWERGNPFVSK